MMSGTLAAERAVAGALSHRRLSPDGMEDGQSSLDFGIGVGGAQRQIVPQGDQPKEISASGDNEKCSIL